MKDYFYARIRSFGYAFNGIYLLFSTQKNAQIHAVAVVCLSILGYFQGLSYLEWAIMYLCMGLVIALEAVNTALEFITDKVSPEYHPLAGKAKDVAAGAVLIAVIFSAVVWGFIFFPKWL